LEVRSVIRHGRYWALKTDFENFFGSINREILGIELRNWIADEGLCKAILDAVSPVISIQGRSLERRNGLPQGSILGPFLSNLYMHEFDVACSSMAYFRYADDMLILNHSEQEAIKTLLFLGSLAARLGLKLNRRKCDLYDLRRESAVFLGYELRGGNIYPPERSIVQLKKNLLKFRGQPTQAQAIMKNFAYRFRFGRVRRLFRRLDYDLQDLRPPGPSLVALLDVMRVARTVVRGQREDKLRSKQLRSSQGQGCHNAIEKATRQPPAIAATGDSD